MNDFVISTVASFIALVLYSLSYFFKSKRHYLVLQGSGNVCLAISFLLLGEYFTMVSVVIGILRAVVCYYYEARNRRVPIWVIVMLCSMIIASFFVVNTLILKTAKPWDILYLVASCLYAVVFTIRNLTVMRYVVLVPHVLSIAYNLIIQSPIFTAISYTIELIVTVVAIIKFRLQDKRDEKNSRFFQITADTPIRCGGILYVWKRGNP